MRQARDDAAYIIVACTGCLAMFHGLGVQSQTLETLFVFGAIIGAVLYVGLNLRRPHRLVRALITIPLLVLLSYGLVRALFWYFMTYLPSQGSPLIKFGS